MSQKNQKSYRFGNLYLVVAAALLVCAGAANAQTEPRAPEATLEVGPDVPPAAIPNYPPQCPTQEILAGKIDGFVTTDGVEATAPSATLKALSPGPYANFDATAQEQNRRFVHTFRLPPCKCLVGAKLEFLAKALGSCGPSSSNNDSIGLGFSGLSGFPRWTAWLGSGNPAPPLGLSTPSWGSAPLQRLFTLDLAALPVFPTNTPPNTISILSAMQTNKYLDFYLQDDTAIDYMKLKLTMCDCCQGNGRAEICILKFHDKNGNGKQETTELGLPGWAFQANDQAGGNLVTSPPTNAAGKSCFSVLAPATYAISEVSQVGWIQTTPVNPQNPLVTLTPGGPVVNLVFGNRSKGHADEDQTGTPEDPN
ncbi:MAG TPA: SdrD B-like domain-containing protein [Thermoanaerobaculia bacterium]|nr:SdrD B-like domain-containing protein [Thermoanaerobaculia bacterium]